MTPHKFAREMSRLQREFSDDLEKKHSEMDKLMCGLLILLGYREGVEIFEVARKWYA